MTAIVDHSRDHDLTVQGSQAARARAIAYLCVNHDLPTVSTWSIDDLSHRLSGLIMADCDEDADAQREKVRAWAEFLHADVTETTTDGRTTVSVESRCCEYGVPIRIRALLRADPLVTPIAEVA
jgi:hypothetical protein